MIKASKIAAGIILTLALAGICLFYFTPHSTQRLPLYFNYSNSERELLKQLDSTEEITPLSLTKWDNIMFNLVKDNKLGDVYSSRLYAYVYISQRDASFLSKNVKGRFMGSLEPVTAEVLCLFFPDSCSDIRRNLTTVPDEYSKLLAEIVKKKIQVRMQEDQKQSYLYSEKKPPALYWRGIQPYYGQDTGSWKTWLIESGHQFIAPPPPAYNSPEWKGQINQVKKALKNITPEQATAVVFWAGGPSTITPAGIWLVSANDYLFSHQMSLDKILFIRSILAMGIADSLITVFNSKYTYWNKRPFMRDKTIYSIMSTPNHPSYPAGHSALSATAATILSFYLPENKTQWNEEALIASKTRIWGGIHFPVDGKEGAILGKQVGDAIIKKIGPLFKNDNQ